MAIHPATISNFGRLHTLSLRREAVEADYRRVVDGAAAAGVSPTPKPFTPSLGMGTSGLLRRYLLPFRLSNPRMALLTDVKFNTFYGWLYKGVPPPIEKFVAIANLLQVRESSHLFYSFYRTHLDRYFDVKVLGRGTERRIVLVTRTGPKENEPFDFERLQARGLGGFVERARIARGEHAVKAGERIGIGPETIRKIELGESVPDQYNRLYLLDKLIAGFGLNESAAYMGGGHLWVPEFIDLYDGRAWGEGKKIRIGARQSYPYQMPTGRAPTSQRLEGMQAMARTRGRGFGRLIREARLLAHLRIDQAEERLGVGSGVLRHLELDGHRLHKGGRVTLATLQTMASVYAEGWRQLMPESQDVTAELVRRHNRHFYPRVPDELLETPEGPLHLYSPRDYAVARSVLKLPADDLSRRVFTLRRQKNLGLLEAGEEWGIDPRIIKKLENPRLGYIPSLDSVRCLARAEQADLSTLDAWRRSVAVTFYPEIPWPFLERQGIYIASETDRREIHRYAKQGAIHNDHPGWRAFLRRVNLRVNFSVSGYAVRHRSDHHKVAREEAAQPSGHLQIRPTDLPNHVSHAYHLRVPDTGVNGLIAGGLYVVLKTHFMRRDGLDELIEGVKSLVAHNLPTRPYLIVDIPYVELDRLEQLRKPLSTIAQRSAHPHIHGLVVSGDQQLYVEKNGKKTNAHLLHPELPDDASHFRREAVAKFLAGASRHRTVSPYPTPAELAKANGTLSTDAARQLAAVYQHPELVRLFPGLLSSGRIVVPDQATFDKFAGVAADIKLPVDGPAIFSTATYLGVSPDLLWLHRHRDIAALFALVDPEGKKIRRSLSRKL